MMSPQEISLNGVLSFREEKGKNRNRFGWEVLLDWPFVGY